MPSQLPPLVELMLLMMRMILVSSCLHPSRQLELHLQQQKLARLVQPPQQQ
jgi:hypothetical protein